MWIWWAVFVSRSRMDSATTGFGKSGYQSSGLRFEVITIDRLARSVMSS